MSLKLKRGRIIFKINGGVTSVDAEVSVLSGVPKREPLIDSQQKVVGFTEEGRVPGFKVQIFEAEGVNFTELLKFQDAVVTVEYSGGDRVLQLSGAFCDGGDDEYNLQEGKISTTIYGERLEEIS